MADNRVRIVKEAGIESVCNKMSIRGLKMTALAHSSSVLIPSKRSRKMQDWLPRNICTWYLL